MRGDGGHAAGAAWSARIPGKSCAQSVARCSELHRNPANYCFLAMRCSFGEGEPDGGSRGHGLSDGAGGNGPDVRASLVERAVEGAKEA